MTVRADLIIEGALVFDGDDHEPELCDVVVHNGRIVDVDAVDGEPLRRIQASGLCLAPGFIDVHAHDDLAVLSDPTCAAKVAQGVTTVVTGNCGFGPAPYAAATEALGLLTGGVPDGTGHWDGHAGYLHRLRQDPPSCNVAAFAGHGTLRLAAAGWREGALDTSELRDMREWLDEALSAGALGLSSGLAYPPGCAADADELAPLLADVVAAHGIYATHLRDESARLTEATIEAIDLARRVGVSLQLSHHKAMGRSNWGSVRQTLDMVDEVVRDGLDVWLDMYPYTSASTLLAALLAQNAFGDGDGAFGRLAPEHVRIASAPGAPHAEGVTLATLAEQCGEPPIRVAERLVEMTGHSAVAIIEVLDEADVVEVLSHRRTLIGSDGLPSPGQPHPRLHGTFPRMISRYARDRADVSISGAIWRMTGSTADRLGLRDRGRVATGYAADLVLFDLDGLEDGAGGPPRGVCEVFVNGRSVWRDGVHTGERPGRVLTRPERQPPTPSHHDDSLAPQGGNG